MLHDAISRAAAPCFAALALLSALDATATPMPICGSASPLAALTGMTTMYALMSAVHLAPWLRRRR